MRITFIFSIVLIFAFSAFAQTSKDNAAIQAVVQKLVISQTNYDQKAIDSLLTPDYIEVSPLGEVDPRNKVIGFYSVDQKPDPTKMTASVEVTDYNIRSYCGFAVVIARLNYTMTSDGQPLPSRSVRATILLKKERSDWKIASAQYTGIRPPALQPTTN